MAQFKSAFRNNNPEFPVFKDCTVFSWKFQKREMFYLVESHPVPNIIVNCFIIFFNRIYGDKAPDIVDGLKKTPAVAVPLVLKR